MKQRIYKREFWCATCNPTGITNVPPMDRFTVFNHLREVHKLRTPFTGTKSLDFALDFQGGHSNTISWTLAGGVKIMEVSSSQTVKVG